GGDESDAELSEVVARLDGILVPGGGARAIMVDERHCCVVPAGRVELVERPDHPRAADVDVRVPPLFPSIARVPRPAGSVEGGLSIGDDRSDRLLGVLIAPLLPRERL